MLLRHFFSLTPAFFSHSSNSVELQDWNASCNRSYETPFSWRQIASFSEHLFPILAMYCCDIERFFRFSLQASSMDCFVRRMRLASIGVKVAEVNIFFIARTSSIARWAVKLPNNKQNVMIEVWYATLVRFFWKTFTKQVLQAKSFLLLLRPVSKNRISSLYKLSHSKGRSKKYIHWVSTYLLTS